MQDLRKSLRTLYLVRSCLFCALICALLCINFQTSSYAATKDPPPTEFKVAYFPTQEILGSQDNSAMHVRALFKILSKYINNEITFVPMSDHANAPLDMLREGKANVAAFLGKSPERMFNLKFSKNPITITNLLIVTEQGKDVTFNDRQALNGKTIAIYADNTMGKGRLDEYLVAKNVTMQYKIYHDPVEFAQSDADFHMVNSFYFVGNKDIVARIGTQEIYFATIPKYAAILDELDYALEQAKKLDADALHKIDQLYLNKSSESLNLSAAEKYVLNTRKPYKIGYSNLLYPMQYTSEHGESKGIAMGVHKLFTQMHPTNQDELIPYAHNTGEDITKYDIVFSMIGDTELKRKHFIESKPYLYTPMFVFEPIEQNVQKNPTLGILDYSVLDHAEIQKQFPRWKLKVYDTFLQMFNDYSDKTIQYMLVSKPAAEHAFSELGAKSNKITTTNILLPLKLYIAKKHAPTGLNILNAFIDALNSDQVKQVLFEIESTARSPATALEYIDEYKFIISGVIISILSLLLLVHFIRLHLFKRKLHDLSLVDKLTGLATKEKTFISIEHKLQTISPDEYMVITLDIDKFQLLNQVYGKEKADEVLCLFAKYINELFGEKHRAYSICRLRDDVFLVFTKLIPKLDNSIRSDKAAELESEIKKVLHGSYSISLSIGIYVINDTTLPVETIVDYSNIARFLGKREHGISINYFDESIKKTIEAQKEIIYKMEQGIENKEFKLNFQPKINLKNDTICGAEVLVRWYPSDGSVIYPDSFIPVFEANAFIANLDLYVFEKTCQFISTHRDNIEIPPLAVNLSGISVMHPDTRVQIHDIMNSYDIKSNEIEIEITESAMVSEATDFNNNIQELCDSGLKLAIDDFGTGVSSLYRLSTLCVDTVKLDKSFLDAKFTTKKGIFLVSSVITMLRRLGMQVVAEGVETEVHIKILKKLHCDMVQGYYYFKPLDESNFLHVLAGAKITKTIT